MPVSVPLPQAGADVLCCLGLGLVLAAGYDGCRFVLGRARLVCFVLDLLFFALAGVLVCSYAASRSYAGVPRWYHLAGMAAGLAAYYQVLPPVTWGVRRFLVWLLGLPFRVIWRRLLGPLGRLAVRAGRNAGRAAKKSCKKPRSNAGKRLQTPAKMLYNSK